MYWDREGRILSLFHSCVDVHLHSPVRIDIAQLKLSLGITCPRHRRLLKARLGAAGRLIRFVEWNDAETGFVRFWSEAEADAQYERTHRRSPAIIGPGGRRTMGSQPPENRPT